MTTGRKDNKRAAGAEAKQRPGGGAPAKRAAAERDDSLGVRRVGVSYNSDPAREEQARLFAVEAARTLGDDKCTDVLVLDLRGRSQMTDFFVIASGTSDRQMRSAGQHVVELAESFGTFAVHENLGEKDTKWLVFDFVDVVVHLFEPEQRLYYDIEMLWGDAPRVEWARSTEMKSAQTGGRARSPRNRAGLRSDDVL